MKKIIYVVIALMLILSACGSGKYTRQQVGLTSAILVTNDLIESSDKDIVLKFEVEFYGNIAYEGTSANVAFNSDFSDSEIEYSASTSVDSIINIFENLIDKDIVDGNVALPEITYMSSYELPEIEKFNGEFLRIKSETFTPFYRANTLYFDSESNIDSFDEVLNEMLVDKKVIANEQGFDATYELNGKMSDYINIVPFLDLESILNLNDNYTMFLHTTLDDSGVEYISHIELVVFESESESSEIFTMGGSFVMVIDLFAEEIVEEVVGE